MPTDTGEDRGCQAEPARLAFVAPERAQQFVLASGRVGWVSAPELTALEAVQARRDELGDEVDAIAAAAAQAYEDAYRRAAADAESRWQKALDRLHDDNCRLRQQAASLAVELAEALVRETLTTSPERLEQWLARWEPRLPGPVVRVRAAPPDVAHAAAWSMRQESHTPVVEDATLSPGDAVLETADGQLDLRLACLLGPAVADVADELAASEGTS